MSLKELDSRSDRSGSLTLVEVVLGNRVQTNEVLVGERLSLLAIGLNAFEAVENEAILDGRFEERVAELAVDPLVKREKKTRRRFSFYGKCPRLSRTYLGADLQVSVLFKPNI